MSLEENKPVKVLEFHIGYLFACMPFFKSSGKYEAFNCVTIADGYLGATDGIAMLIVEDEVFKGCDYLLSGESVRGLYDKVERRPMSAEIEHFALHFISDLQAIAVVNHGEYEYPIELQPYKRLDLKKVDIEKPDVINLHADQMPYFNPDYLTAFMSAGELSCGHDLYFMQILPTGRESAIYIDMTRNMHGVLMPAKLGGTGDYKSALHAEMFLT